MSVDSVGGAEEETGLLAVAEVIFTPTFTLGAEAEADDDLSGPVVNLGDALLITLLESDTDPPALTASSSFELLTLLLTDVEGTAVAVAAAVAAAAVEPSVALLLQTVGLGILGLGEFIPVVEGL